MLEVVTVAMRAAGMVLNETSTCLVQTFYLTDYSLDVILVQRSQCKVMVGRGTGRFESMAPFY